ncbi:hypothetical protein SAMN05216257_104110 [Meinhardsimonia xiamenensis]|jgi:hypothetical protein|uniref:Uncharacterized protein n=1 Tax=Meinhardsimonia xiamenensis TaxID=990712 RepID=A0A1G9E1D6_9RHOB|nr:hypothetical protein [Meinhardsimonia xiamenensis]PRX33965.1 hypothetical protein LV81_02404 [Meinhardsimonia xiamenensis]SDK69917.1 hypothetical protein SAMN05216257_104110 [Meinhardsimonia xiamenensis]
MRQRVYRRWIAHGRITETEAEYRIAIMKSIAADYAEPEAPNLFGDHDE